MRPEVEPTEERSVEIRTSGGRALKVRTRLTYGWSHPPGVEDPQLDWHDVLESERPKGRPSGTGAYVVPLRTEIGRSYRRDFATRIVAHADGHLEVEELVSVRPRLMLRVLRRHNAKERKSRVEALHRINKRATERILRAAEVGGVRGRMHRAIGRFERKHGHKVLTFPAALARWLVELPDHFYERVTVAARYVGHGMGRKELRRGIKEPRVLTVEGKSVLLLFLTTALVGAVMGAHTLLTLAAPSLAGPWRTQLSLFTFSLLGTVALPIPVELSVVPFAHFGSPLAIAVASLAVASVVAGRTVGAYLIFFVGEELNEKLDETGRKRPWLGKGMRAIEAFARRFGFAAVTLFMAIPFFPELVLYLFGSARMPMRTYIWGVVVGSTLRFAIIMGALAFGLGHVLGI